jgi:hypothetical protein
VMRLATTGSNMRIPCPESLKLCDIYRRQTMWRGSLLPLGY